MNEGEEDDDVQVDGEQKIFRRRVGLNVDDADWTELPFLWIFWKSILMSQLG